MGTDPIIKTAQVPMTPDRAFDLFTAKIASWWPVQTHSVSAGMGAPSKDVIFHGGADGKIEEIAHDGSRHIWGRVTDWVPGVSLGFTWHPGKAEDRQTYVRVEFKASESGTLVTLTHEGWENLSDEDRATHGSYREGWNGVLALYQSAA